MILFLYSTINVQWLKLRLWSVFKDDEIIVTCNLLVAKFTSFILSVLLLEKFKMRAYTVYLQCWLNICNMQYFKFIKYVDYSSKKMFYLSTSRLT